MPHLVLEYTGNLAPEPLLADCFARLHAALADLGVNEEDCKSRARRCDPFLVGTGQAERAFFHLTLSVLDGRSEELRRSFAEATAGVLAEVFAGEIARVASCDVTVEVREMRRAEYSKTRFGGF